MKYYLSSYKFGNQKNQIKELAPTNKIAIIPNALDFREADSVRTSRSLANKVLRLSEIGLDAEVIDLKSYFGREQELKHVIESMGSVFVLGGSVFILRQAMKLSGLDSIICNQVTNKDFLYAGYSAAGCVLAPSLEAYEIADTLELPYKEQTEIIWEGLDLVEWAFMPHYKSDHPETKAIDACIRYCKKNNISYKTIHDGEVLIFED